MSALEWLVVGWAGVAAGYSALTAWRLKRPGAVVSRNSWPRLLLLRPVDAPTPREVANLAAPLDYPGPVEQLVLSPRPLELPGRSRWIFSDPPTPNRKVGHLCEALARVPVTDQLVLSIDADVKVDGALLKALVEGALDGAQLTTAPPLPVSGEGPGFFALQALLCFTHQSFPALAASTPGAPPACGKAMALGPRAREMLPSLSGCVGEDLELASRLHRAGHRVHFVTTPALCPQPALLPLSQVLDRFTRWMQVLGAHRPALLWTVPLLVAPTLLLCSLGALLGSWAALWTALLVFSRTLLAARLAGINGASWLTGALSWPLGEALLLTAFFRSLGSRHLQWRGRSYTLGAGGQLHPISCAQRVASARQTG